MRSMVVTLEVSKLSGWLNAVAYCQVERRAYDGGGGGASREAGGPGVVAAHKRHAQGCPNSRPGGQGHARRAHEEHGAHVRDLGRVKAERLVERRRVLPSQRESMRCGARCEPGGGRAWGGGIASGMHGEGPTQGLGARARAERTANMPYMFVTLDVSQLEMSALKFFKFWKSSLMSVIIETSQSAIGPYVAMAEAAFELNSVTAVFREVLLVKVWGDGGGGDGDGGGGLGGGGGGL
jgi:hypothetical protein